MRRAFQYFSDIHLEYRVRAGKPIPRFKASAPYLALCGDIGDPFHNSYKQFLHNVSHEFDKVFVVAGNHEYSKHTDKNTVEDQIHTVCNQQNNLIFLKDQSYQLDCNTYVYGSTLWAKHHPDHSVAVKLIEEHINSNTNSNTIMLTHYLPSFKLITDDYKELPQYKHILDRWATDLDHIIRSPISSWICGHSHCMLTKYINGVKCAINAPGSYVNIIPSTVVYSNYNIYK